MKKLFFVFVIAATFAACNGSEEKTSTTETSAPASTETVAPSTETTAPATTETTAPASTDAAPSTAAK